MNVKLKTIQIIAEHLGTPISEILPDSHLVNDLNAAPLEKADLITRLEEIFKIQIPDEISQKFTTVGDIINFIQDHADEFTEI